ncbi:MAG: histidine kinase, partial [Spirochaetales bacterium]|nr:histidine kinase [Spirochaetales bacterium]
MAKAKKKKRVFSAHEVANFCDVVNQTAINWIR